MGIVKKLSGVFKARGLRGTTGAITRELYRTWALTILGRRYVVRKIYNFRMKLDLQDRGISRALWLFGYRELDHKWLLEKTLRPHQTILDIGANIGYYALLEYHLIGANGAIIAVEPSQENINLLEQNLKLNSIGNVEVINGAVSNYTGRGKFWLARESNLNTFHKEFLDEKSGAVKAVDVDVFSVRDIVARVGSVDYVRMDIEGHEVEVLGNIASLVEDNLAKPAVIFETHTRAYSPEHDIGSVITHLYSLGYVAKYVSSSAEKGTGILKSWGLPILETIQTDDVVRTVHQDVPEHVLLSCLTETGGIRTVYLQPTGR